MRLITLTIALACLLTAAAVAQDDTLSTSSPEPMFGIGFSAYTNAVFTGSSTVEAFDNIGGDFLTFTVNDRDLYDRVLGWEATLTSRLPKSSFWVQLDIGRSSWAIADQVPIPEGYLEFPSDQSLSIWNYRATLLYLTAPHGQRYPLPHGGPYVQLVTEKFSGGPSAFIGGLRFGLHYPIIRHGIKMQPVLLAVDGLADLISQSDFPRAISLHAGLVATW